MDKNTLDEVIACLPEGRTFYHYHRDRYVLLLLEQLQREHGYTDIRSLRQTAHAGLLQKNFVREWLATQGRADVPLDTLLQHWPQALPHYTYLLSLGRWGQDKYNTWRQTSRPGWNLVLHLNLPMQHQRMMQAACDMDVMELQWRGHPRTDDRLTLAWSRIDLDWDSNEALIEEVQSDWVRHVRGLQHRARFAQERGRQTVYWRRGEMEVSRLQRYAGFLLAQEKIWHEAMLSATLWFLWHELGIRRVYYHSWQTGNAVKHLTPDCAPPRSLYSELPERFGFSRCAQGPDFLEGNRHVQKVRRRQQDWSWYHWAA
ncbi:MAG TPA: hypothetical protein VF050_05445 [Moraxellaceae bacterium]